MCLQARVGWHHHHHHHLLLLLLHATLVRRCLLCLNSCTEGYPGGPCASCW